MKIGEGVGKGMGVAAGWMGGATVGLVVGDGEEVGLAVAVWGVSCTATGVGRGG